MRQYGRWKALALTAAAWLILPGGAEAQTTADPAKHLDRSKLSETFWNTGMQGGIAVGRMTDLSNAMFYPYVFSGVSNRVNIRPAAWWDHWSIDNDNSMAEGVWLMAKDPDGKVYITHSGPRVVSKDVVPVVPQPKPGGNLKLSNGTDPPLVRARLGYDSQYANAWYNSDRGTPERPAPLVDEPVRIDNYRGNGQYILPQHDSFPESTIITRWTSNGLENGTGMTMTRYAYGWSNPDFDDFFIVELTAENTSGRDYEEVYMGYMNIFSISRPGHSVERWSGSFNFNIPNRGLEDDRYQYTEASNYTGKYRGMKVSYEYDEDNPLSGWDDRGEPFAQARLAPYQNPNRVEGELLSPAYIGWGPADLTPPFVNDPEIYVPITGTAVGGPDIPEDQPRYAHWWKVRSRSVAEFLPDPATDNIEQMWKKIITPNAPVDPNSVDGGPKVEETFAQLCAHSQIYGPWRLKKGEKAKIVLAFAAGMASEIAGPGGEPMDERLWMMSPGARGQLPKGEDVLFDHIKRARQFYKMGYDLPNQPPDVPSIQRRETNRPVLLMSSPTGHTVLTWTDGADSATNPDYTGAEAKDVIGYRIYSATALESNDPGKHAGTINGPWRLIADIKAKDPKYYSNGVYTFEHEKSITGFRYWYNIATYAKGHADWQNVNARTNAVPGAQPPAPTTLADLPPIVQKHIKAGYESSHLANEARNADDGTWYNPVVAASANFDALEEKVMVVPNPWNDDGVHSYGSKGTNDKTMRFTNLPRLARISIFNAGGDLLVQIVHDGTLTGQHVGEMTWPQSTRGGGGQVTPGIYFFVVESLVPGQVGKIQRGSFLIIK